MTTITRTDPYTVHLEFTLIRLSDRLTALTEAAAEVCAEAPETPVVTRLRELISRNNEASTPPEYPERKLPTVGQAV